MRWVLTQGQNNCEYINSLIRDLKKNASAEVHQEADSLFTMFVDSFAVSDLGLGNFVKIEHRIDTGDARPVEQRMLNMS